MFSEPFPGSHPLSGCYFPHVIEGELMLGEIKWLPKVALHSFSVVELGHSSQYWSSSSVLFYWVDTSLRSSVLHSICSILSQVIARKPGSNLHLESRWGWWWVERCWSSEGQRNAWKLPSESCNLFSSRGLVCSAKGSHVIITTIFSRAETFQGPRPDIWYFYLSSYPAS